MSTIDPAYIEGDFQIKQDANDDYGNLSVEKDATIGNDLSVTGDATIGGDTNITGDVTVSGSVTLSGDPVEDNEAATKDYVDTRVNTVVINVKAKKGAVVTLTNGAYSTTLTASVDDYVQLSTEKQGTWVISATYYGVAVGTAKTITAYKYHIYDVDLEIPTFALYGVRHYVNESSPALTRLADSAAYTFTPETSSQFGSSSFDDEPIFKDIKLCNVDIDNSELVITYEDDPDFSRTPLTGDVCVEIPKFYFFRDTSHLTDETPYEDVYISDVKLNNSFATSPAHMDRSDGVGERDKIYLGCYETNGNYRSVSGQEVLVSKTPASVVEAYHTRSQRIQEFDILDIATVQLLYMIEVANLNSQASVGSGNMGGETTINTGTTDALFYCSGQYTGVKYRGLENLWGNCIYYVSGLKIDADRKVYFCPISVNETFDDSFENYTSTGITLPESTGDIKKLSYAAAFPFLFLPIEVGGTTSTYYCDQFVMGSSVAVFKMSGARTIGAQAGIFYSTNVRGVTATNALDAFRLHII